MKKEIVTIGEALIDFIPLQKGVPLSEVVSFERNAGGAPLNVAANVAKRGGKSSIITQLGNDSFGDYIFDVIKKSGVGTDKIFRTSEANTALAFVSLSSDGNRSFSFYRNPCADLLLESEKITDEMFDDCYALHFCSVDLIESPAKHAHKRAIKLAKENGAIISFDPNVRLPLFREPSQCYDAIWEFMPYADILKVSDDELEFIFGTDKTEDVVRRVMDMGVRMLLITLGADGACLFTKELNVKIGGIDVQVVDTTGAGDSFIGSFLYALSEKGRVADVFDNLSEGEAREILEFANRCAANTTTQKGAIV